MIGKTDRYDIPQDLNRKKRQHYIGTLNSELKKCKSKLSKLIIWCKTLSEDDIAKATNFNHEDKSINAKFRVMAGLEQSIVYYTKLVKKVKESSNPIPNGNYKQTAAV